MINPNYKISEKDIAIVSQSKNLVSKLTTIHNKDGVIIFDLNISTDKPEIPGPIHLKWKLPAHNVKGVWKPTSDFSKRIQADWELEHMESRVSIDSPIVCLFGNDDSNRHTFACSNAINKLELNAVIREEDDCFYCHITFFAERYAPISNFNAQIRIDSRVVHFSEALQDVSRWWETFEDLKPTPVPESATVPLYSTWYNFHQNLEEDALVEECKIASSLGYKAIILDDGWQTKDDNRGYDYTGDWQPDRLPYTKEVVERIQNTGLKVGFWYSVPFCGKKSKAYKKFKGKFLTEDHRWAPVFDPRYPDVRAYLITIYKSAIEDWNLDGFKLDFIDDFRLYPDTNQEKTADMDYQSINEAVDRLLTDVISTLRKVNPEVFIEFRQKYTGPAMRKYGNMFRAFDCPGDGTMNRIRIADIRMLAGNTAVHSDMVTWHKDESTEIAALQLVNTLFGVPQISVMLRDTSQDHLDMIRFYTEYWNTNKTLITQGNFKPYKPLANYPINKVSNNSKVLYGVFDDYLITVNQRKEFIDIVNGKPTESVILKTESDFGSYEATIYDCKGHLIATKDIAINSGITEIKVPACGLIQLQLKH